MKETATTDNIAPKMWECAGEKGESEGADGGEGVALRFMCQTFCKVKWFEAAEIAREERGRERRITACLVPIGIFAFCLKSQAL